MAARQLKRTARQAARRVVVSIGKRFPFILRWTRKALAGARTVSYRRLCAANPVDPKVVVFEAYSGRSYACSPRALYQAMLSDERFADYEFIWVFLTPLSAALADGGFTVADVEQPSPAKRITEDLQAILGTEALDELKRAKIVRWGSREYMRSYARAGTWISNFVVPPYLTPREGQVYLETWHGTPLKQLGCDISAGGNVMYEVRDIHEQVPPRRSAPDVSDLPFAVRHREVRHGVRVGEGRAPRRDHRGGLPPQRCSHQHDRRPDRRNQGAPLDSGRQAGRALCPHVA